MALRDSEIRALRALRAGPLTRCQAEERWPSVGPAPLYSLSRAGLAAYDGAHFTITDAGRAACPFNNPILAARAGGKPKEENTMPRNKIARSDVFDAICAAGPDGTTVKALAEKLSVSDQTIFNRLKHLTNEPGAVVRRPRHGVLVASRFLDGAEEKAPAAAAPCVDEAEVAKIARQFDEMIDFDLEAAQSVDVTAVDGVDKGLPRGQSPAPTENVVFGELRESAPFSEDIELDDPEQVEFAIFSSGGLDMYTDQGNVTLGREVLRKLRAFLGLFAEAA